MAYLSTAETAKRLGFSRQHIVVLIERGELRAQKVGRVYIIDERSIVAFERRDRPGPGRPAKGYMRVRKPRPTSKSSQGPVDEGSL